MSGGEEAGKVRIKVRTRDGQTGVKRVGKMVDFRYQQVTKFSSQADVETRGIELYGVVAMTNAHEPMEKEEDRSRSPEVQELLDVAGWASWVRLVVGRGAEGAANLFLGSS